MDIEVRQLRLVVTVARTRSFTETAAQLRISQPAVSRSIRDVERALRTQLFERTTRTVEVTDAGREFATIAETILREYDHGLGRFAAYQRGKAGTISLAALPSLAASLLPTLIRNFVSGHPDAEIRVMDGLQDEILTLVRSGVADLAVGAQTLAPTHDLTCTRIGEDPLVAVLPANDELAGRSEVTWVDLARRPFVAVAAGSSVREMTDIGLEQVRRQMSVEVLEAGAITTAAGMIAAGLGRSAVPESVAPLLSFANLITRPLAEPALTRHLTIYSRAQPPLPPLVQLFRDMLCS
jgi:LysR family transcriptional regulator, carnitine catabolism transcriptional activator